ncbi:hypothetical protein [Ascidiimonas sp. W6]|uniref:hypothetical protein n=1 Tax=Ascidiimonas meishanensis TaxID=3128903 RepID=UPI0030EE50CC
MKIRFQHIASITLLGIFLSLKIVSIHSLVHLFEDEDIVVENCIDCEYHIQVNKVPVVKTQVAQVMQVTYLGYVAQRTFYVSTFTSKKATFNFANKAPPALV